MPPPAPEPRPEEAPPAFIPPIEPIIEFTFGISGKVSVERVLFDVILFCMLMSRGFGRMRCCWRLGFSPPPPPPAPETNSVGSGSSGSIVATT